MTDQKPTRFGVNSMGEYWLEYADPSQNRHSGSVNVVEFARELDKSIEALTEQDWKHKWDGLLYKFTTDLAQVAVYRAWEHLQPLDNGYFRFYGFVDYPPHATPWKTSLIMVTEYLHPTADKRFFRELDALAAAHGATTSVMVNWEDGTDQIEILWNVRDLSFLQVAALQAKWLLNAEALSADVVNVV